MLRHFPGCIFNQNPLLPVQCSVYPLPRRFFQNYTLLVDGVFSIAIFLILLLAGKTILAIQVITGYLFSGVISQKLKHLITAPRPHAIISGAEYPYFIEGITYSGMNSFPSALGIIVYCSGNYSSIELVVF